MPHMYWEMPSPPPVGVGSGVIFSYMHMYIPRFQAGFPCRLSGFLEYEHEYEYFLCSWRASKKKKAGASSTYLGGGVLCIREYPPHHHLP